MAKDGNTYAKRQRETLKRQKQEDKRNRRRKRKGSQEIAGSPPGIDSIDNIASIGSIDSIERPPDQA